MRSRPAPGPRRSPSRRPPAPRRSRAPHRRRRRRPRRPSGSRARSRRGRPRSRPAGRETEYSPSATGRAATTTRRVIESRIPALSAGVRSSPSVTQKIVEVGASSTTSSGRTSRASSAPPPLAILVACMFAPYESDLTPLRISVGRVGDAREPDRGRCSTSGSISAIRRPPRVTTSRSWASPLPVRLEQRLDLGLELGALRGQLDRGSRALEPVQVLGRAQTAGPRRDGSPRTPHRRGRGRRP